MIKVNQKRIFIPERDYSPLEKALIIHLTDGILSESYKPWTEMEKSLAKLIVEKPIVFMRGGVVQNELPQDRNIIIDMDCIDDSDWTCPYCNTKLLGLPGDEPICAECLINWVYSTEQELEKKIRELELKDMEKDIEIINKDVEIFMKGENDANI